MAEEPAYNYEDALLDLWKMVDYDADTQSRLLRLAKDNASGYMDDPDQLASFVRFVDVIRDALVEAKDG